MRYVEVSAAAAREVQRSCKKVSSHLEHDGLIGSGRDYVYEHITQIKLLNKRRRFVDDLIPTFMGMTATLDDPESYVG